MSEPRAAAAWLTPELSTVLDHVRSLAAFLVLLNHLRLHTIGAYGSDVAGAGRTHVRAFFFLTGLGHEAVIAFFVLSGALIAGRLIPRRGFGAADCASYLLDRLTRIWIVALPALLFSAALAHISRLAFGDFYNSLVDDCAPGPLDLSVNLLFLHKAFFPTLCSDGPYWSIHNEVWYYLLLPALLLTCAARALWLRGLMLALIITAMLTLLRFDPWDSKNTLAYGPLWLAGAMLATGWRWRLSPVLAGALFLSALLMAKSVGDSYFLLRDYLVGLALLALLLAVQGRGLPARWLRPGPVGLGRRLAGFSYSLYLTHAPVIFLIRTLLERRLGVTLPIRAVNGPALAIMLVEGVAALAAAWLFWLAFERHTGALRAAIRARLPRPPQASSPRAIRASQAS